MKKLTLQVRDLADVLKAGDLSGEGSLVDQVYAMLRESIINLALPPDLALVEQDVAAALDVSKTPVREAIIRLAREGLVRVAPKSGTFVTPISLERYLEACFVRTQLELGCVQRLATAGVNLSDEVRLKAVISEQEKALHENDDVAFYQLDESLHRCLFEVAGLSRVWELMNVAKAEMDRVRHLKRAFGIRQREQVIEEHAAIVKAIVERDPARAKQALLENIGAVEDQMNAISQNPQLLRSIEDLNKLVPATRRPRGGAKA